MQFRLPPLPRWAVRLIHWINLPLVRGYRVRRIDLVIVLVGLGVGAYYWHAFGPLGAITGVSVYLFIVLIALWF